MSKTISIFGASGSVGQNTIKAIQAQSQKYDVKVLTAYSNAALLAEQAVAVDADYAVIGRSDKYQELKQYLEGTKTRVMAGEDALIEAAQIQADWTMAAIVGMAGLPPLMKTIEQGGAVAIANKEPLVAAGALVMAAAKRTGATLLPVDSEHNAVFQVFENSNKDAIEKIILTASGGPFCEMPYEQMKGVTPAQALKHPNWEMGAKISIDSATMMNKALEVIEAKVLFDVTPQQIEVLVHPQSIIHSMVEYCDGSVLAQMGAADMCTPITNALGWPERLQTPGDRLDVMKLRNLEFMPVDLTRFPSVSLAYTALEKGAYACVAMNAANEIAVKAFLDHKIAFLDIYELVSGMVHKCEPVDLKTLEDIISYDNSVRRQTESAMMSDNFQQTGT